ncbi:MAG TPA: endolytic transglycosylase MltG [Thermoanaerobaculia bacterium]
MSAGRRILRLGLLLVALALAVAAYLYQQLEHPRPPVPGTEVTVFFPLGTPTTDIFRHLAGEGVLRFPRLAEAYYRVARSATPLQAGEYRFDRPTPLSRVIDRMARGDVVRHVIVVPEGLTAEETFALFWSRGISRPNAFRNAFRNPQLVASIGGNAPDLEGFLFPDTYSVTRSTSARQIVEAMLANFRRHFTADLRERAHAHGLSPRDTVTLASIVQKETALPREAGLIAGIYWNRLHRGMRLQADPTVTYALQLSGKWSGTLYRSDYGFESDYNTYLHAGLPPGPICNPGFLALKAASDPAATDFLYFVADGSGGHRFSRTFEEHRDAIAASRRQREEPPAPAPAPAPDAVPASTPPPSRRSS